MQKITPIWTPSFEQTESSLIALFAEKFGFTTYPELHAWSCANVSTFWESIWNFCGVIGDRAGDIYTQNRPMEYTRFFEDSRLNFAENILRQKGSHVAITFWNESLEKRTLSYDNLHAEVSSMIQFLEANGVVSGDRVAGCMPNIPETVIAMLATASIGGIWSSCSPDFGVDSVCDRYSQIAPKILIMVDGYAYGGKHHIIIDRIEAIQELIPSIEKVIVVPYLRTVNIPNKYIMYPVMLAQFPAKPIEFKRFPFNHPLLILFSSGTTGKPKCIVHGAGGTLIQHMKEHQLQCDIKPKDTVFYYTTCGWMMWNWLVSALASNASLVLFDGSPTYPTTGVLFDMARDVGVTLFGTSAKYLSALHKVNYKVTFDLPNLRTITSTGSPLAAETYDYVYESIHSNVLLSSISGGTDIVSCFLIGNMLQPIYRGQLQCAGLGYKIEVYNEDGKPLSKGFQGELVCTRPFPTQPVCFWNDPKGEKYHNAYYGSFDNIWHHGDLLEQTEEGGFVIRGRSDTVLNPGGVRIGTAEIYNQVQRVPEVLESIAIGQEWDDDIRVILFVMLKDNCLLDDNLKASIKEQIRTHTTPRHVPSKVIQVADLPRTKTGKLAEIAVRNVVHGKENTNLNALANPESLNAFRGLAELQT
ncbi:MAG: acetoacetate--CoA ligase [Candidatus Paracaedibacteraceae bacterium]|nr:acetoacetate--CoA ligase [Candidatus Paracaedibacteraceae bacterium]